MVTHIFLSSNLALPPVLCRLVIFNGPSPSDRLDEFSLTMYRVGVTRLFRTTPVCHDFFMTLDALDDGECCNFCGTPVFFYGEGQTDCPKCGATWVNAEDDPADRLDGPAVDDMEFDNDPDMIENDEFDESGEPDDFG